MDYILLSEKNQNYELLSEIMSSSKLLSAGLKRKLDISVEKEFSTSKRQVPDVSKVAEKVCRIIRQCSVNGCQERSKLHSFPTIYKRLKHQIVDDLENISR